MPLLTIADAATQLATSRRTVEREIAGGKQYDFIRMADGPACTSIYGLCE